METITVTIDRKTGDATLKSVVKEIRVWDAGPREPNKFYIQGDGVFESRRTLEDAIKSAFSFMVNAHAVRAVLTEGGEEE